MAASTGGSSQKVGEKRKRVVLSIEDKLKIIKLIESNVSYTVISERFGIGRSTVCDINRTKDEIRRFSQKMVDMGTKNAKTRKVGEYEKLDEALYIWFRQQRDKNIPVMKTHKAIINSNDNKILHIHLSEQIHLSEHFSQKLGTEVFG